MKPPVAGSKPVASGFNAQTRCLKTAQHSRFLLGSPLPVGALVPLRIKAFNPTWSRASSPSGFARFPFAPRHRLSLNYRSRINVPGPLRFRKPAVPQTSWNLLHHAPCGEIRQTDSVTGLYFSSCQLARFFIEIGGYAVEGLCIKRQGKEMYSLNGREPAWAWHGRALLCLGFAVSPRLRSCR